ncbi:hypothetical protein SO802_017297 [Lithocarpus litseifolius]|uniref:Uncharacterized protein n=1 Tax=Lithocarpus litseifolius TaxID=425828 RepID=A0AAW2D4A7_9ROSI
MVQLTCKFYLVYVVSDKIIEEMVLCFPSTPKKLLMTVACFVSGAALFAAGVHLSYVNIAPQQARTKARNDFVKERLRKKYGLEEETIRELMWQDHQYTGTINVDLKDANIGRQDLLLGRTIRSNCVKIFLDVKLSFRGVWLVVKMTTEIEYCIDYSERANIESNDQVHWTRCLMVMYIL